ncbi:tRNA (adenosine(37)-N6)-threonylcarbamoyltransferase complex ATPase subunit type 1 TsaE [Conservatibacter flavescens]|uniref:tRNA threonylcarbamoyladenosine biosynthesis protein TsaE n=1 Tax=Conservatibacter flavescens TaxID=28161 RepID=A0A2M8S539_9PAST|nr:tRNA (adenosine(37)-N6)-threonylcarbamoyltransferase complex ATPase subunit type 1 TsaE [Conservatibacter flavescens]PJG86259.1 tRNA (adenosine(37)-N6)-threonylcarbamoyltransferase complex ATPase subunit type 1 TsaE [Conservatibacter flavescens]
MNTFSEYHQYIVDENAMCHFGQQLIKHIDSLNTLNGVVLYLNGELGAGKTTLSRGMIQGLGYHGNVKSPTYTLVEEYHLANKTIYHFDLYRLSDPEELEFMGIRDYFAHNTICLLEWAEKGQGLLPPPDLFINITYAQEARDIQLIANSSQGEQIIQRLKQDMP